MMKKLLIAVLATSSVFLISCSTNKSNEESTAKTGLSKEKDTQEFLDRLSYEIDTRIIAHFDTPKNWDEALLFYFIDFGVLQKGYNESCQKLTDRLKHQTVKGWIVFSDEDNRAFERGLKYYEEQASNRYDNSARKWLVSFYCETTTKFKDTSRGLYWALKDAEFGGGNGMMHLAYAFASGKGVMQDPEESLKWLILAQATDNGLAHWYAKAIFKELENSYSSSNQEILCEIKPKALRKAKAWMREHPDAFFNFPTS